MELQILFYSLIFRLLPVSKSAPLTTDYLHNQIFENQTTLFENGKVGRKSKYLKFSLQKLYDLSSDL